NPGARLLYVRDGGSRQRPRTATRPAPEQAGIREACKDLFQPAKRFDRERMRRRHITAAQKNAQRILVLTQVDRLATREKQIDRKFCAMIGERFYRIMVGPIDCADPFASDDV